MFILSAKNGPSREDWNVTVKSHRNGKSNPAAFAEGQMRPKSLDAAKYP